MRYQTVMKNQMMENCDVKKKKNHFLFSHLDIFAKNSNDQNDQRCVWFPQHMTETEIK